MWVDWIYAGSREHDNGYIDELVLSSTESENKIKQTEVLNIVKAYLLTQVQPSYHNVISELMQIPHIVGLQFGYIIDRFIMSVYICLEIIQTHKNKKPITGTGMKNDGCNSVISRCN